VSHGIRHHWQSEILIQSLNEFAGCGVGASVPISYERESAVACP
jgi:hypothetical protein